MKVYAKDLVDFLNRDWGAGSLGCIDMEYLSQFSSISKGRFTEPKDPSAIVDLDELNAVAVNISLKDEKNPEAKPIRHAYVTLARLCKMLGVKDARDAESPDIREHPKLPLEN